MRISLFFLQLYFFLLAGVGALHAAQNKSVVTNGIQSIIEKKRGRHTKRIRPELTLFKKLVLRLRKNY